MNRTRRDLWREQVWFLLANNLLWCYCERPAFQWLLDIMYFTDTSPTDAAMMIHKLFVKPEPARTSGMQLLHEWRLEPDDPLENMEGGLADKEAGN